MQFLKRLTGAAALATLVALGGCQTAPTTELGISAPPTATFNDRAALVIRTGTEARKIATARFRAGKITASEDLAAQTAVDQIRAGVEAARALQPKDPVAAEAKLNDQKATADKLKSDLEAK